MTLRVVVNGLGRTGRQFFRASLKDPDFGSKYDIIAFNDLANSSTLAYFFKYDSIHGRIEKKVTSGDSFVEVDGKRYSTFSIPDPSKLPWGKLDIDVVIESTGLFTKREDAEGHLKSGARKVLISAPSKNPDVTLVPGVNITDYDPKSHRIISGASCTTNCLAPMAKVLLDNFGLKRGFMSTVHAYTNDQRILDMMHKSMRRSRAASVSIIPTSTGAAQAIGIVLPELRGRMHGMAFRVPVPDGSIVDLVAELNKDVSKDQINETYIRASKDYLKNILSYTLDPIVSADIIGNPSSCIIDGLGTTVMGDNSNFVKVLGWYDNEWAYACRLIDIIKHMDNKGVE